MTTPTRNDWDVWLFTIPITPKHRVEIVKTKRNRMKLIMERDPDGRLSRAMLVVDGKPYQILAEGTHWKWAHIYPDGQHTPRTTPIFPMKIRNKLTLIEVELRLRGER